LCDQNKQVDPRAGTLRAGFGIHSKPTRRPGMAETVIHSLRDSALHIFEQWKLPVCF
jgi:hypothetical protein